MGHPAIAFERYTYAQYKDWPEDERWELIDGIPYSLAAPLRFHQDILRRLFLKIGNHLQGSKCVPYTAPFDLRLFEPGTREDDIENVVQPDISVFCNPSSLDKKGAIGAPDWIIEILSPSTAENDLSRKLILYQRFKVKEYWIVNPDKKSVLVYKLNELNMYFSTIEYSEQHIIIPELFPDLKIDLKEVFAE